MSNYLLLSYLNDPLHALLLMGVFGLFNGFINIQIITKLQTAVSADIRGRVFGLLITLTGGLTPISMGLAGIIFDLVNQDIALVYSVCGIAVLILSILTAFSKNYREFLKSDQELELATNSSDFVE